MCNLCGVGAQALLPLGGAECDSQRPLSQAMGNLRPRHVLRAPRCPPHRHPTHRLAAPQTAEARGHVGMGRESILSFAGEARAERGPVWRPRGQAGHVLRGFLTHQ